MLKKIYLKLKYIHTFTRSSHPEVFLIKSVLKICSKFTGEHPGRSAISINRTSAWVLSWVLHGCSPVNLLHISRTTFSRNTSGLLLLVYTSAKVSSSGLCKYKKFEEGYLEQHIPQITLQKEISYFFAHLKRL